ncbi:zinc ribbon domain-containing protein [Nonomuraea wenchangensis]|uniref:zinc ribbon domain-containing protein n=1 Tax=Nonomuraea wenchangensis TaxID=568860 RepID=UPI003425173A
MGGRPLVPVLETVWRLRNHQPGVDLADRVWTCGCGLVHDRDVNAARNLLEAMNLEQEAA